MRLKVLSRSSALEASIDFCNTPTACCRVFLLSLFEITERAASMARCCFLAEDTSDLRLFRHDVDPLNDAWTMRKCAIQGWKEPFFADLLASCACWMLEA